MSACSSSCVSIIMTSAHLAASGTSMTLSFASAFTPAEVLRSATATFLMPESRRFQRVRVPAAVADDGDVLGLDEIEIGVAIVVDACGPFWVVRVSWLRDDGQCSREAQPSEGRTLLPEAVRFQRFTSWLRGRRQRRPRSEGRDSRCGRRPPRACAPAPRAPRARADPSRRRNRRLLQLQPAAERLGGLVQHRDRGDGCAAHVGGHLGQPRAMRFVSPGTRATGGRAG